MNLTKFPDGKLGISFEPREFGTLLEVLNAFQPASVESQQNLELAKAEVRFIMQAKEIGNATIN